MDKRKRWRGSQGDKEYSRSTCRTSGRSERGEKQRLRYPLFTKTKGNTAMPPLTETQRYQIEHDIRLGMSNARIATGIGCSCRTIEYEVGRCGSRARYRAAAAQADRESCALNSAANHPTILKTV